MSVYTVHEPPAHAIGALPDAERFVFVRDGFSFWAFVAAPLWMLWHRMWLPLAGYVLLIAVVVLALAVLDVSESAVVVVGLLIALLVGLEASTLRRFSLRQCGWSNVGIVSGDDLEDAERRFFDAWLRAVPAQNARLAGTATVPASANATSSPRVARGPDVIGLFPEPGAQA